MTDRFATCINCHRMTPSSRNLPFFRDCGPSCEDSMEVCRCGHRRISHDARAKMNLKCQRFVPHGPWLTDEYDCGCKRAAA